MAPKPELPPMPPEASRPDFGSKVPATKPAPSGRGQYGWFAPDNSFKRASTFETEDELIEKAIEYLKALEEHPLFEEKVDTYRGAPVRYQVQKYRAPTIVGFTTFIGISEKLWYRWLNGTYSKHLREAAQHIREVIRARQTELGAAELINPAFTARLVGLADKTESTLAVTGPPPPSANDEDIPNLVHPDAPIEDQLSDNPILFSRRQLEAGVPYPKIIEHKDAAE